MEESPSPGRGRGRFSTRVFISLGAALRFGVASSTGCSIVSLCTGVTGKEGPHSVFFGGN